MFRTCRRKRQAEANTEAGRASIEQRNKSCRFGSFFLFHVAGYLHLRIPLITLTDLEKPTNFLAERRMAGTNILSMAARPVPRE